MDNRLYRLNYRLKMLQDRYYNNKRKYKTLINELNELIHDVTWDMRVDNYCSQHEPKFKIDEEFYLSGCYEIPTPQNHIMFQKYGVNSNNLNGGLIGKAKIKYIDDITYNDRIFYLLSFLDGEIYVEESILSKFEKIQVSNHEDKKQETTDDSIFEKDNSPNPARVIKIEDMLEVLMDEDTFIKLIKYKQLFSNYKIDIDYDFESNMYNVQFIDKTSNHVNIKVVNSLLSIIKEK